MVWRAAKSLPVLHQQLRPLAPGAPASSWGLVGDLSHTSASDHSPHNFPGWGTAIVTAADFPKWGRLDPRAVLDQIRRSHDPRVKYGISEGQLFSSYATSSYPAWTWRPYSGSDRHADHGHLSVVGDARADQTHPWQIAATPPGGADMDPNGHDIHPDITNKQVIRDIWDWISGDRQPGHPPKDTSRFKFPIPREEWLTELRTARAEAATGRAAVAALAAQIAAGGGNIDTTAVLARMNEIAVEAVARDAATQQRHHDSAQAEADALGDKP